MHWGNWFIVISALVTMVFTIRTMGLPLKRLGRWKYGEEWIIVGLLLVIAIVTLCVGMIRS